MFLSGIKMKNFVVKDCVIIDSSGWRLMGENLGIPKVEREAKRLHPMCQEEIIRTTQISDPDTWFMSLELSLRRLVYARFESLLAEDLTLVQIRALKLALFDNFLRTDLDLKSRLGQTG